MYKIKNLNWLNGIKQEITIYIYECQLMCKNICKFLLNKKFFNKFLMR